MNLLVDPTVLRMGALLFAAVAAFGLGWFAMRLLRKNLVADPDSLDHAPLTPEGLPVHAYHAVIQQLKQQKHELLSLQQVERRRAKTSENISAAVLSNLLELYSHDLSDVFALEPGVDGRFGYEKLPLYWSEPESRLPFLIRAGTRLALVILADPQRRLAPVGRNPTLHQPLRVPQPFRKRRRRFKDPFARLLCRSQLAQYRIHHSRRMRFTRRPTHLDALVQHRVRRDAVHVQQLKRAHA